MLRLNLQSFSSKGGMGSSKNSHGSESRRLGLKKGDGQYVPARNILVRQRGTGIRPGENVGRDFDDTLFATANDVAKFERKGHGTKKAVSIEAEGLA